MSGTSIAPLFLRLVLAVTFLWAGFGKVLEKMPVSGQRAATLANMGVGDVINAASGTPAAAPASTGTPASDARPSQSRPEEVGSNQGAAARDKSSLGKAATSPSLSGNRDQTTKDEVDPQTTKQGVDRPTKVNATPGSSSTGAETAPLSTGGNSSRVYTSDDFPSEVRIARVYGLALLIDKSAHPVTKEGQAAPITLWPPSLATGSLPVYFAWAAMVTEVVGGLFVLVGLLTRISALSLAGTMIAAMWLTELGPAIQSDSTFMGLLPAYGAYAMDEAGKFKFMSLLWQFALCGCGLALMFAGPGYLSFDRALFPGRPRDESL
jgi:uncharacterized membrane protein YphA (DoxX/SURF4 family)